MDNGQAVGGRVHLGLAARWRVGVCGGLRLRRSDGQWGQRLGCSQRENGVGDVCLAKFHQSLPSQ